MGSVDIDAVGTSTIPLLISTGTDSPELEAGAARELARRLPEARFQSVQGSGHIPHRTHPDEYVAMLTAFLDEVTSGLSTDAATGTRR